KHATQVSTASVQTAGTSAATPLYPANRTFSPVNAKRSATASTTTAMGSSTRAKTKTKTPTGSPVLANPAATKTTPASAVTNSVTPTPSNSNATTPSNPSTSQTIAQA